MMATYVFPYFYPVNMADEEAAEIEIELTDDEAWTVLSSAEHAAGFAFEDVDDEETKAVYDKVHEAAAEALREMIYDDPSIIAEWLDEWGYLDAGLPVDDEQIEQYFEELYLRVEYPEPWYLERMREELN